ncbi:penicillin acylase family protein [Geomicrobium sp. JSM 1781026]|uniref:penicillin acylase family protein n=1 Tax=Geomicrobium sp. JSM 1781026 TaxID=3344580 RepID=UPI0035BFE8AB
MPSTADTPVHTSKSKRKRRRWTIFFGIIAALFVLVIGAFTWGWVQLGAGLPQTEGVYEAAGLESEVDVYRDDFGVPHIEATSDYDLYYAQGFVTAQDRMFQMDLSRRQASGELSEVIGVSALDTDKYFRTFGLRRAAHDSYELYSDEALVALHAYADGVNDYVAHMTDSGDIPIEFRLLGYTPTAWTAIDSLTIGKFMAYDLGGTWQGQAFRYWLANNVTDEEALDLMPVYPEDGPVILDIAKETDIDIERAFANVGAYQPEPFNGSNNWVVSGDHTESGMPLLADDPHLGLATPSIWYETHLSSPDVNVTGVIFAGVPGIILGHNDEIAWGVTNVGPDVQELYIEQRHPEDPTQFLYEDEWYNADIIEETILVDGYDEPVSHEVVVTRHGPLISEYTGEQTDDMALALRWTALDASTELEAVMDLNRAGNWEEFTDALEEFHAPAQNFVYADKDGNIGYRANGRIPIRENSDALLPVEGWTGEHDWDSFIPWDELPTLYNPESGMISTANNQIDDADYPYHISHTWAQPYRHEQILAMLEEGNDFTSEDMQQMQMNVTNLHAKEFLPIFFEHIDESSLRNIDIEALDVLREWNLEDAREEGGALVFHLWFQEIPDRLFADRIPEEMLDLFEGRANIVDELLRNAASGDAGPWVTNSGGLEGLLTGALQDAVDRAEDMQGGDPDEWQWGDYHQVTFGHPLGAMQPLDLLFNPTPEPVDGSRITVMAAGYNDETGNTNHGAGWRGVMDIQDLSESYHIVGPGQSGHVRSDHYDDQLHDWVEGTYHATTTDAAIYQETSQHLQMVPAE